MLSESMKALRDKVQRGEHRSARKPLSPERYAALASEIQDSGLSLNARAALRLRRLLENERVTGLDGLEFVCMRTIPDFPDIYAPGEKEELTRGKYVHEQGRVCNIAYDYAGVIANGLLPRREAILAGAEDGEYARAAVDTIDAVLAFSDRHSELLAQRGDRELADNLRDAVRYGAKGFREGLQLFRILHCALWASNVYHNTVGRFDQYMYPLYRRDIDSGRITRERALELLHAFFLTFNLDSDMYQGMQQGDNGQSIMLGGCTEDGGDAFNELTQLCLEASLDMRLIDPKVNLRVNSNTPLSVYEFCTRMTRQGLGFPQYANDDVVIPALVDMGYALKDARNYVVAACWEFIIPGVAMDIPNIGAVSLAAVADRVIREKLAVCQSFEALMAEFGSALRKEADAIEAGLKPLFMEPAPYASVLMSDPAHEISKGARYNNYGIHGTGFAPAVDQLCTVKQLVFEEKRVSPQRLLAALNSDFADEKELLSVLRREAPKLGRDAAAEPVADQVLALFADSWQGRVNERGGIFRPGTGSAMYYIWHARDMGFTADGHVPGEPLPANFSPSLLLRDAGPLSVIQAFARPGIARCINGGPLTLEMHDSVFKNDDGLTKVAQLVKSFIALGGHQLQLNAVSVDTLKAAQRNPEAYANLIVRVWGWSGHFVLLDRSYQDQIIARTSYAM